MKKSDISWLHNKWNCGLNIKQRSWIQLLLELQISKFDGLRNKANRAIVFRHSINGHKGLAVTASAIDIYPVICAFAPMLTVLMPIKFHIVTWKFVMTLANELIHC